jgi:carbon-monoxide dehydrogenase medium subunit
MWDTYTAPGSVSEALDLLARHGDACRIIAGGTDLILELERGARSQRVLVDVSRISGLDGVTLRDSVLRLGALATHSAVVAAPEAVARAFPLARACWLVGAPQIRNRGTVAGNLVTASPANDTITPLWAMDATVTLGSKAAGERTLGFDQFFLGVRRTALQPDEMLLSIHVPALGPRERGTFLKLGLRQAQAISVVNAAVVVDFDADGAVRRARIALGAVAPTIVRAVEAETYLAGRDLTDDAIERAAELAASAARPISDIRGSAEYRTDMARVLVARGLCRLRDGTERVGWPARPVVLRGRRALEREGAKGREGAKREGREDVHPVQNISAETKEDEIRFSVNRRAVTLRGVGGKTLLRALREDVGLTGTKEGCAEGECGACTVWLDGVAVMSCLVPVERAGGCAVTTVEGLTGFDGALHPIQQAFVEAGAVQCGYCTPGFLMSAANLLDETAAPTAEQVREALTGNLCRCTGYYRILEAVERAAALRQEA